jgi:hypothetical protein
MERRNNKGESKMKTNVKNTAKIQATLDKEQIRATARTLDADEVVSLAEDAEERLERLEIPKKSRVGSVVRYSEAVNCNSYGYRAEATLVELTRGSTGWFLTACHRAQTGVGRGCASRWFSLGAAGIEALTNRVEALGQLSAW